MPEFLITAPDGRKYRVKGENREGALAAVKRRQGAGASPQPQRSLGDTAVDVAKQLPTGIARGAAMVAGLPGDVSNLMGRGIGAARDYLVGDVTPEQRAQMEAQRQQANILPTTEGVMSAAHNVTGMSLPEPQTTAGEYARTVGEFAPAALGPGGPIARTARPLLSGLGSEAAGQATEGTAAEPYARIAGALPGGLVTPGRSAAKVAAKGAPSAQALRTQTNQLYQQLRNAGVQYDPKAFNSAVTRLESNMIKEGLRPSVAKEAFAYIDDLKRQTGGIDFDDLNGVIRVAGDSARAASRAGNPTLAKAFGMIRDDLGQFEQFGAYVGGQGLPRSQINSLTKKARQTALKNIKQRELNDVLAKADTYQSGVESGIRNGLGSLLRSKRGRQLFKGAEREALLDVAQGRKALRTLSRFGYDLTSIAGNATFLPTVGAIGAGALLDPIAGAGLAAAGTGAKMLSPVLTNRAFNQASAAIRSGRLNNVPRLPPKLTPKKSAAGVGLLGAQGQLNLPR